MIEKLLTPPTKKILVIGDVIQDHYIYGVADRISPEAPVPVIKKSKEEYKLGGAANVYQNLKTLGARCEIISVVGEDESGYRISDQIEGEFFFYVQSDKKTSTKTRIVADTQQVIRIDSETCEPISQKAVDRLWEHIKEELKDCGLVVLSDYGKGVLTNVNFVKKIIKTCVDSGILVLVDPHNGKGSFDHYQNATLIKVNKKQSLALTNVEDTEMALCELVNKYSLKAGMITLSENGMLFKTNDAAAKHFPCVRREIFDVTGAGDSTLAVFAYCLAVGLSFDECAELANFAGQISVQHQGTYAVTIADLIKEIRQKTKIITKQELCLMREVYKNKKIVFSNGCFDLLHPGHVEMLKFAKSKGDILIVGLNSDVSVKKLKSQERPIICEKDRALMLEALTCVDHICIFNEETPTELIESLQPDIHVKGGDHKNHTEGVETTLFFERVGGYSTTNLIR